MCVIIVAKGGNQCDKSAKFICDEFCVCPAHKKLKSYSDKKFKKIPKQKVLCWIKGNRIVETLNAKPNLRDVDKVVIENQPALKNPTMKIFK